MFAVDFVKKRMALSGNMKNNFYIFVLNSKTI